MSAVITASENQQTTNTTGSLNGVWVQGSTLMTPLVAPEATEVSEPMDMTTYRMPHDKLDPDNPSREFHYADKW